MTIASRMRKWRADNPEKTRSYSRAYRRDHPSTHLWSVSKSRAKLKGMEHTITPDDLPIPIQCPYLGIPLTGVGSGDYAPSVDRVDNTRGYVPGNVEVVSRLANKMKSSASPAELRRFAQHILGKDKDV